MIHKSHPAICPANQSIRSAKDFHHEMILDQAPNLPSPRRQQPTTIRQFVPNHRRTTEENPYSRFFICIPITITSPAFQQFLHVRVMPVHDVR
jgi:hypothetical protein